ncbi:MAG: 16S rRNA pseudouridine(516) synthase, partial [Oscillospiraceae bacterium]|nr:16S rRNA pseudouridine(516) synthase [Oscillospiraceae bacterium]
MSLIRRLDQALAVRGFGSRKEVSALLKTGAVTVNGLPARRGDVKIHLERDSVAVRGHAVPLRTHVYLMLHKPAGVISAARDPKAATVLDLVPEAWRQRGLFPVGRLDKDTTGLLLLTDDGALAHALLSPRRHVPKTYLATLQAPATPADVAAFAGALVLPPCERHSGEICLPAQLVPQENNRARVVLHEGKYHQIKR